ncbi:unnamed protein product, partial [Nippostrongylus brasiliensis]|uniref:CCHC-type domain-containing protein n=1 Tax=Nippostrongylus brasiliensis TaxID=27835 RepID=A0A0N4XLI1_NIPBR
IQVEKSLTAYTEAADALDSDTPQLTAVLEKVSTNSFTAQDHLLRAYAILADVNMALEELSMATTTSSHNEVPPAQLAPLPIPKFSGKIWEWENFWNAFNYSVHSRNLEDIYKMNYLMEALQGEARRTIIQFQVSGANYTMAIDHLKKKYGNPQLLLSELVGRLEKCHAGSRRMEDQRTLYEELSSIVNQMRLKGESVDNVLLQKQLLSKFSEPIQRHVLRKKQEQAETWTISLLLSHVSNFIDTEAEIQRHVENEDKGRGSRLRKSNFPMTPPLTNKGKLFTCFFCEKTGHSPRNCPEYTTREQRLDHMRRNSLCLNCGERNHRASDCSKGACRICNKTGHHTSICRQATALHEKRAQPDTERKTAPTTKIPKPSPRRTTRQNFVSSAITPGTEDNMEVNDNIEAVICLSAGGYPTYAHKFC